MIKYKDYYYCNLCLFKFSSYVDGILYAKLLKLKCNKYFLMPTTELNKIERK